MQKQPEDFLTETIDEQIEHMLHAEKSTPAGSVVRDLQGLYERGDSPEQVRHSLDSIWSRLADRLSPEQQTLSSTPETGPLRALTRAEQKQLLTPVASAPQPVQAPIVPGAMSTFPARPVARRSSKRHFRRTLTLSALAALVLLGVFSWALVARLSTPAHGGPASGSGTPVPTIPATPAPQSQRDQAHQLLSKFHQEVTDWGQAHQYQDAFNGKSYKLDYAYDQQGIGGVLDHMLAQAQSTADYQQAIDLIQDELTNLHTMQSNSTDQTPWNQAHSADSSLLSYYKLQNGTVMVVSLLEQSMRVYQHGQLVKAFRVTTGRNELPSLPGSWNVYQRQENVVLKSPYPKDSPYWFPPTPVKQVLAYHTGGYMIFCSWWRANYGSGTNFPHTDTSGNSSANNGSEGNIELAQSGMAWLYANVQVNDPVVIY